MGARLVLHVRKTLVMYSYYQNVIQIDILLHIFLYIIVYIFVYYCILYFTYCMYLIQVIEWQQWCCCKDQSKQSQLLPEPHTGSWDVGLILLLMYYCLLVHAMQSSQFELPLRECYMQWWFHCVGAAEGIATPKVQWLHSVQLLEHCRGNHWALEKIFNSILIMDVNCICTYHLVAFETLLVVLDRDPQWQQQWCRCMCSEDVDCWRCSVD